MPEWREEGRLVGGEAERRAWRASSRWSWSRGLDEEDEEGIADGRVILRLGLAIVRSSSR